MNSFIRIMTKLQIEGVTIESSKASFKTMKRDIKIKSNSNNIENSSKNSSLQKSENENLDV